MERAEPSISPLLRLALVADLAMDVSTEGDGWLEERTDDDYDWTRHFGRQLGFRSSAWNEPHLRETLLFLVRQVDDLLRGPWPPTYDHQTCDALADGATKHLSPVDLYATLLAGPPQWGQAKIDEVCRVNRLSQHLQPILRKGLATAIKVALDRWLAWDIRKLRQRRREALDAKRATEAEEQAELRPPRVPYQRPTGRDRADRIRPLFQPPGRT